MCLAFALTQCSVRAAPVSSSSTSTDAPPAEVQALITVNAPLAKAQNFTKFLWSQPAAASTRLRKRHSKRHSNWYENYNDNYDENSMAWELVNPCNGVYMPNASGRRIKKKNVTQIYINLKKSVSTELNIMKSSPQDIDISNIQMWFLHNYTYKFLPKMKLNSSIPLKRWYRNMQTYLSTFAYLHRAQMRYEHSKSQPESPIAGELKSLFLSSRGMLCELESAINSTRPYNRHFAQHQPISRAQVNKRLKLRTKRDAERHPGVPQEADTIDLKFAKYYYYEFLETMWKVLRRNTKRKGQIALKVQRQDFNEVEKNFGSISSRRAGETGKRKTDGKKKRVGKNPKKQARRS